MTGEGRALVRAVVPDQETLTVIEFSGSPDISPHRMNHRSTDAILRHRHSRPVYPAPRRLVTSRDGVREHAGCERFLRRDTNPKTNDLHTPCTGNRLRIEIKTNQSSCQRLTPHVHRGHTRHQRKEILRPRGDSPIHRSVNPVGRAPTWHQPTSSVVPSTESTSSSLERARGHS